MLQDLTLGFIGTGNMARALIKGLTGARVLPPERICVFDKAAGCLDAAAEAFAVQRCAGNREVVQKSDLFVLAVKPQNIRDVLTEIQPVVREGQLVVSIAAGIPLRLIQTLLAKDLPVVRVMPNTPALVQAGISAIAGNPRAGQTHLDLVERIFQAVGQTVIVTEDLMDAVTALSGSGPGYVFRLMEAMVAGGRAAGLSEETALALVVQTFAGAAQLAASSKEPLARLREMVTSPGGTTAAGLNVLNERGVEAIIVEAIQAACSRSRELGKA
ncbi:Pyrroline-5-carboxylate reductase [uncultured Desulfatiglans sp.]|nr:Pyrroline-5-carboxylate reductase [uncultured Desulfatiglans sp.]